MVSAANLTPTGGAEDPQNDDTSSTATQKRLAKAAEKDPGKGQKFKEVLNEKLIETKKEASTTSFVAQNSEEEGMLSPLSLASQSPVKKVKSTKDALDTPQNEGGGDEEAVKKAGAASQKPKKIEITVADDSTPKAIQGATQGAPKVAKTVFETPTAQTQNVHQNVNKELPLAQSVKPAMQTEPLATPVASGKNAGMIALATASQAANGSDTKGAEKGPMSPEPIVPIQIAEAPAANTQTAQTQIPKEKIVDTAAPTVLQTSTKEKPAVAPIEKKVEDLVTPINLMAAAQPQVDMVTPALAPKVPDQGVKAREVLIKLAEQMISELQTIKTPERTDTTIKLQYPPLFNGAEIQLTEFTTSQKQFNVTFSGLTPDAQALIQQNQTNLRAAIASLDKGYTIQMITIKQDIPGLQSLATGETAPEKREKGQKGADGDAAGALR